MRERDLLQEVPNISCPSSQGDRSVGWKLLGFAKWIAHSTLSSSPFGHSCFAATTPGARLRESTLEWRRDNSEESRMYDPFCKAQQFPTDSAISLLPVVVLEESELD